MAFHGADQELVEALRGLRRVDGPNGVMKSSRAN